jgi:hypothetical protein
MSKKENNNVVKYGPTQLCSVDPKQYALWTLYGPAMWQGTYTIYTKQLLHEVQSPLMSVKLLKHWDCL